MSGVTNATPLMALDAVVIDTETTSLDPRKARILEAAGIRIVCGRIETDQTYRSLVNPRETISAFSTAIHGIDNDDVADAPSFADMWPALLAFVGQEVVIGHTLGFDLAVLQQECKRAGLAWRPLRTLDTQHLVQLVDPRLGHASLDDLADMFGIEVTGRHSALGDAKTTAHLFQALVPRLRDNGIRTFAEAAQACRALSNTLDRQHRAGWITPEAQSDRDGAERMLDRVDSYPYRHRIRDVMSTPPKIISADHTLGDALVHLIREQVSSLYVAPAGIPPERLPSFAAGIVTERDILRALAAKGEGALQAGVEEFMSRPLATIPSDAFVYRGIGRMSRMKIRHLGVTDDAGMIVGALSARDMLRLRAEEAISLGDEIDEADDAQALGAAWAKLAQVARSLRAEGIVAGDIAAIISRELGALTRQATVIAERRMVEAGDGEPPCPYAMTVLGSAGRGESLLAMDQDNALVFERGRPDGPEDKWFAMLGTRVADLLNEVGVPYCNGGVMASNPNWRGSVATWQLRVSEWVTRSSPQDLLAVDTFFDMRGVYGQLDLADSLWRYAYDAAEGKVAFAKLLVEASGPPTRSLGFFGGIRTRKGRIDLKRSGLFAIVSMARALAIRHHILERATPARLRAARALDIGGDQDIDALLSAYATFQDFILAQQLVDIDAGRPASNTVAVKALDSEQRERLRTALQSVRHLDDLTRGLLFKE